MQVQRITDESYKPNFKSLKILHPNLWDENVLNEFVHNLEVQKFVKYYHDQGINIRAFAMGSFSIDMYKNTEDSFNIRTLLVSIYPFRGGLKSFNAAEAISKLKQVTQEKIECSKLIQQAQEFVDNFNKALDESKNQTTIWKVD